MSLDKTDRELIKILQAGLPLVKEPYVEIGNRLGLSGEEVISRIKKMNSEGVAEEIRVSISPHKVGVTENSMTVWNVPEDRIEEVGRKMAKFKEVTHCYQRPRIPGKWPYTLFCMLHAPTREKIKEIAKRISREVGINDYWFCFATKEYIDVGKAMVNRK